MSLNTYPVLIEPNTLADLAVRQDHWGRSDCHTLLQTFESLTDALEFGGHQRPRVSDGAEPQLSQVLGGQVLRLPTLDDWLTRFSVPVVIMTMLM